MSALRPAALLPSLLVTGKVDLPESSEGRTFLFTECLSHRLISWDDLLRFHRVYRASPIDWPRSFADSYGMLRLAVIMWNTFGDEHECAEVLRMLAYHLFDRDLHPELIALLNEALPRGVLLLLTSSPRSCS